MTLYIAPIVEGQTEDGCIERLLQRVWTERDPPPASRLQVLRPSRGNRGTLVGRTGSGLADKVEEAHEKLRQRLRRDPGGRGLLFVLLDAEDDCPAELGPRMLAAARRVRGDADIVCVVAKRMLENWIVAGASTLAGVNGLPDLLPVRDQFEELRGAQWLDRQLRSRRRTRKYKKTEDAEPFVRQMDLNECRRNSSSFDKLCRELEARLPAPPPDPPPVPDEQSESAGPTDT